MLYRTSFFAVILFFCSVANAGSITFVIDKLPEYHLKTESIFLAGSINGWVTSNPHYQFKLNEQGQLALTVPMKEIGDKLSFKLTKGTWESVELDNNRHVITNRTYTYRGGRYLELLQVGHWQDKVESRGFPKTSTGDIRIFDKSLKFNGEYRTIRVLLPANYKTEPQRRYPVLYMFDGQNLFDRATASVGMEWQIDEHLATLNKQNKGNLIVVGVDSKQTCDRFNEYTAWKWAANCGEVKGLGAFTSAFLVNEVKYFIDKQFRTLPKRQHTYIGGSSLGGYMAVYTAVTYQNTFSKVLGLSNAVLDKYSGGHLRRYIMQLKKQQPIDFYLDIGSQEAVSQSNRSDLIVSSNQQLAQALVNAGFDQDEVIFKVIVGGVHDETSWSARFIEVLELLNIDNPSAL